MVHAQRFEIRIWELGGTVDRERAQVVHVPLADAYRGARSRPAAGTSRRSLRAIHAKREARRGGRVTAGSWSTEAYATGRDPSQHDIRVIPVSGHLGFLYRRWRKAYPAVTKC